MAACLRRPQPEFVWLQLPAAPAVEPAAAPADNSASKSTDGVDADGGGGGVGEAGGEAARVGWMERQDAAVDAAVAMLPPSSLVRRTPLPRVFHNDGKRLRHFRRCH